MTEEMQQLTQKESQTNKKRSIWFRALVVVAFIIIVVLDVVFVWKLSSELKETANKLTIAEEKLRNFENKSDNKSNELITFLSPKQGETLCFGKPYEIKWQASKEVYSGDLVIRSTAYGAQIASVLADQGHYTWIPTGMRPAHNFSISMDNPVGVDSQRKKPAQTEIFSIIDCEVSDSNWETYKNEDFGFELKYPNNFSFEELGAIINGDAGIENRAFGLSFINGDTVAYFAVSDYFPPYDYDPELDWCTGTSYQAGEFITVSGQSLQKCLIPDFGGSEVKFYELFLGHRNNFSYIFSCSKLESSECDNIVSTFKFIE